MIFVTVGTHEQQFNRLLECIDTMKRNNEIPDDVVIQTGFCTYKPTHCQWAKLLPYQQMEDNVQNARIVITHGGPSSFIMPLQRGKIPIVVPRQKQYGEHVNDHQMDFCIAVAERFGNIIVADNNDELRNAIINYDSIVESMPKKITSNNEYFNKQFKEMVTSLF